MFYATSSFFLVISILFCISIHFLYEFWISTTSDRRFLFSFYYFKGRKRQISFHTSQENEKILKSILFSNLRRLNEKFEYEIIFLGLRTYSKFIYPILIFLNAFKNRYIFMKNK